MSTLDFPSNAPSRAHGVARVEVPHLRAPGAVLPARLDRGEIVRNAVALHAPRRTEGVAHGADLGEGVRFDT